MPRSTQKYALLPDLFQRPFIPHLVIGILAFCLYANTLGHEFTQDDAIAIYDNAYVQDGLSGIPSILTTDTFSGFFAGQDKSSLVSGGRYRPLTLVVFAVIHEFFGANTFVFHLFAVIAFCLLCITIYNFLNRLEHVSLGGRSSFFALAGALIFTIHPIHTEAVANVKGLDETFSLLFAIFSTMYFFKFVAQGKYLDGIGTVLFFLMALLSKENAVAFLAIAPMTVWFFKKNIAFKKLIKPTALLITGFIIYLILRISLVGVNFGEAPSEMMNNPFIKVVNSVYVPFTFPEKAATIIYGLGKYILLLFFPHPLTHDYYPRHIGVMSFKDITVWMSIVMNVCLGMLAVLNLKKKSIVAYSILVFYGALFLMSNILFPIGTHISERFLFSPSLGFAILGAYALKIAFERKSLRTLSIPLVGAVVLLFVFKTVSRNLDWKSDYTLFTKDVHVSSNSAKVRNAAGGAMIDRAITMETGDLKTRLLNQAVEHLKEAVKIHPRYKEAYFLLGNGLAHLGQDESAANAYESALLINPNYNLAAENLLIVLRKAAIVAGAQNKDFAKAEALLKRALAISPLDYESNSLMGTALGSAGRHREAIVYFEKAVSINPKLSKTYINLGRAYTLLGDDEEARINFLKAIEIDPKAMDQ